MHKWVIQDSVNIENNLHYGVSIQLLQPNQYYT